MWRILRAKLLRKSQVVLTITIEKYKDIDANLTIYHRKLSHGLVLKGISIYVQLFMWLLSSEGEDPNGWRETFESWVHEFVKQTND